jgi:glutamate--cysteine ligase
MNDEWFDAQFERFPPPPYCSVDLRNSGYKIAPVDTNLFPAGFNNLHTKNIPHAVKAAKKLAKHYVKDCRRVLIIPESHTRNLFYFESLATLQFIFEQADFEVQIGSLLPEITRPHEVSLPSGRKLVLMPLVRKENKIVSEDFSGCLILLNHDLSEGTPEILKSLSQKIVPPLNLGWWSRKKSDHFRFYQEVAESYAKHFKVDPWQIHADFDVCKNIDFATGEGEEVLLEKIQKLLDKIEKKYK